MTEIDYDKEVEKINTYNKPILNEFAAWLKKTGLAQKTIKTHVENMDFFAEYLTYYEPLYALDEADAGDVASFLLDWYPRKAMWASVSHTKSHMATFRKFFKFMSESNRIDKVVEDEVRQVLKDEKDAFLEAVAFADADEWW